MNDDVSQLSNEELLSAAAPHDYSDLRRIKAFFDRNRWYLAIGIATFIIVVFFPMIQPQMIVHFAQYNAAEWMYFFFEKITVSAINMFIYFAFGEQGELNVQDHPRYKAAKRILGELEPPKEHKILSPREWKAKQFKIKGLWLVLSTFASLFVLENIIFGYNPMELVSYVICILGAIIVGITQMTTAEDYYTGDYYHYALKQQSKRASLHKEINE